jgi:uncharacterized membrane protein YeiH
VASLATGFGGGSCDTVTTNQPMPLNKALYTTHKIMSVVLDIVELPHPLMPLGLLTLV